MSIGKIPVIGPTIAWWIIRRRGGISGPRPWRCQKGWHSKSFYQGGYCNRCGKFSPDYPER